MSFSHSDIDNLSLDRHDLSRDDPNWINQCLHQSGTGIIPICSGKFPSDERGYIKTLSKAESDQLSDESPYYLFLGQLESGQYLFTAIINEPVNENSDWISLRHTPIDDPFTNILLHIQGLTNWLRTSNFCHRCGTELRIRNGGNSQVCINESCGIEVFPRVNPAIIVLLLHQDKCLLAHARHFSGDIPMYSCIAGFMETGEDFEQTLHREVYEEVGLQVETVTYLGNQAWPFPNSLMIGFHATTTDTDVTFHDGEISAADWFSREQIIEAVSAKRIRLPSRKSISYTLIAQWFDQGNVQTLDAILAQA